MCAVSCASRCPRHTCPLRLQSRQHGRQRALLAAPGAPPHSTPQPQAPQRCPAEEASGPTLGGRALCLTDIRAALRTAESGGGGGCSARNGLPSLMRDVAKTLPNLKENRNKESSEWPCLLTNKSLIMVTQKLAHSGWGYIPVHKLSSENIQSWKCTKHIYPTARLHVAQPTSHVLRIIPLAHGGANHPTATVQHSQRGSHHLLMAQQRNEIQKAKYSTY